MARRDATRVGLAVLGRIARGRFIDRVGLRKPAERTVFHASRTGFRTAGAAARVFAARRTLAAPARLPAASGGDVFDLTPTDDQRMMQQIAGEFAAERLRPAA